MRALAFSFLVFSACAHGPPAQVAAAVDFPGARRELSISGNDLFGSEIHLRKAGATFRGDAYGQLVELTSSEDHVKGNLGSAPVNLTVETKDGVTTVRGLFMAELSELRVSAGAIEGKIGACGYDVKSGDG